jgi:phage replication initiation protein
MAHIPRIDYLSLTFPVPVELSPFAVIARAAETACSWGMFVAVGETTDRGRNGYTFSASVIDQQTGQEVGFIAAGGVNRGSCHISVSGSGCPLFDMNRVAAFLARVGGRLTRVDIAVDDYEGKRTPQMVRESYLRGEFINRGQNPTPGQAGPWDNPDRWGEGLTYYIGKRQTGKMLRVYHKGREQGDPESNWTRFEVELRRTTRDIPIDALTNPLGAFVGAYAWLIWAAEEDAVVTVGFLRREKSRANIRHLFYHAKRSYGKLLYFAQTKLNVKGEQLLTALSRIGKPSRIDDRYYWIEGELIDGVGVCSYVQ